MYVVLFLIYGVPQHGLSLCVCVGSLMGPTIFSRVRKLKKEKGKKKFGGLEFE